MALINTTTTGVLGSTFVADGTGDLTIQQNGVTINRVTAVPAFRAEMSSSMTVSSITITKAAVNTKIFDTNSCFDTSNYRFTPNVAGYYQFNAHTEFGSGSGILSVLVYKNGSRVISGGAPNSAAATFAICAAGMVYMNGTTDYVEMYIYQSSGGNLTAFNVNTAFSGFLARAA
jgi:hypothetical protein